MQHHDELHESPHEHIIPISTYLIIGGLLLVLTAATVGVAYVDLGPLNDVVAMAIASLKGVLIILYFMHVKFSSRLTQLVAVAAFLWLAILIVGTMDDFLTRTWIPAPGR